MVSDTEKNTYKNQQLPWLRSLLITIALSIPAAYVASQLHSSPAENQPTSVVSQPAIRTVTALGRLEPSSEIVNLSAPASTTSSRIAELLVKEGERVKVGQIVAILDSRDRLAANLAQAETQVQIAQAKLQQVKAGAKQGDINAARARFQGTQAELTGQITSQKAAIASLEALLIGERRAQQATIARIKAELLNAETDCQRYQTLSQEGAVATQQRDSFCLQAQTTRERLTEAQVTLDRIVTSRQEQIKEARANLERTITTVERQISETKATLNAVAEVRPVDVKVAQTELFSAQAAVKQAQAELDLAYVRSPIDGQVLEIHTRPGEIVGSEGIAEIGETAQMYAVAEVYETDITKIHLGKTARVIGESLDGKLTGTVEQIGLQVLRQNVINTDPAANTDAKVVEVRVRLDEESSAKVTNLTNMQVRVVIER